MIFEIWRLDRNCSGKDDWKSAILNPNGIISGVSPHGLPGLNMSLFLISPHGNNTAAHSGCDSAGLNSDGGRILYWPWISINIRPVSKFLKEMVIFALRNLAFVKCFQQCLIDKSIRNSWKPNPASFIRPPAMCWISATKSRLGAAIDSGSDQYDSLKQKVRMFGPIWLRVALLFIALVKVGCVTTPKLTLEV